MASGAPSGLAWARERRPRPQRPAAFRAAPPLTPPARPARARKHLPTGRYVATSVNATHQMENGFNIWTFNGRQLYQ
jgi:hypothetical protein